MKPNGPTPPWYALPASTVIASLGTSLEQGLPSAEAARRQSLQGPNLLHAERHEPWWEEAQEALTEPLVLLLVAVGGLYALLGELADALTLFAVILAVAGLETLTEARAKRALSALRALGAPMATVRRDGGVVEVAGRDVVQGDVVLLGPGDRVPADVRLTEAAALRVDESSLTGESVPVLKAADAVLSESTELGDRRTMAFAGTLVTAGKGRGVVVATGRATELGRTAWLAQEAREPRTPLQVQMKGLSRWLAGVAVGVSVLVPVLDVLVAGQPWREALLTGLTLAFATIPEELPILITSVLGLGALRLARRHAVVKQLRAAEALGSVSVLGTDKTGTLTQNQMQLVSFATADAEVRPVEQLSHAPLGARLLEVGVLASDAQAVGTPRGTEYVGDPTETALLKAADALGAGVEALRAHVQVLAECPFDATRKRMSVVVEARGERWLFLKGAPDSVLGVCTTVRLEEGLAPLDAALRERTEELAGELAGRGLRVLALAERKVEGETPPEAGVDTLESGLTFLGLVGLEDPLRPGAPRAVAALQGAGVRVLMLTGDHPATALAIAGRVGIDARRAVRGSELEGLSDAQLA